MRDATGNLAATCLPLWTTRHPAASHPQAIVFSVAMHSKRNALLTLLVAANFVEIKVRAG